MVAPLYPKHAATAKPAGNGKARMLDISLVSPSSL